MLSPILYKGEIELMEVKLLSYTHDYHKLCETTARQCYNSFHKLSPDSHKMLKGILATGHVSVTSVGNLVFGLKLNDVNIVNDYGSVLDTLNVFKQINSFVRWTDKSHRENKESKFNFVLSMNLLSLMQIHKDINDYDVNMSIFNQIMDEIKQIPEIYWFFNDKIEITSSENKYKLSGELNSPQMLTEDYTALKNVLTPYELDIHAHLCFHMVYDRATSLQLWRHRLVGGTEVSQRYVDQSNAKYRIPSDLEEEVKELYEQYMQREIDAYAYLKEKLSHLGKKRSQEIARNLLPNILTSVIHSRSLRDWKHLIKLRDSKHAQLEVMEDVQDLKTEFEKLGIKF